MGRHARPNELFFRDRFWIVSGLVAVGVIILIFAVYSFWPRGTGKQSGVVSEQKITRDGIVSDYQHGKFKEVITASATYLAGNNGDRQIRSLLASSLILTGDAERAVKEYRTLVESKPDDADALYQAGVAIGRFGRVKDAIDFVERAVKASPNVVLYRIELARLLAKDGQNDAALTEWQQVLSKTASEDRYRATIFAEMATLYVAKGTPGAAAEIVDNGLKIDPQNEYLKALSAQISASAGTTGGR